VAINEALKKQEIDFRNMCRTEMLELKDQLSKLESNQTTDSGGDIQAAYEADLKRMKQIKKLLALKNRVRFHLLNFTDISKGNCHCTT
jgi:hypothetical protein